MLDVVINFVLISQFQFYFLFKGGAEFVFPTDSKKKRSWGERMFSGIGTSYMCGTLDQVFCK